MDGLRSGLVKRFAAVTATLGWTALATQLYLSLTISIDNGKGLFGGLIVYFSFFTILTNLLVALALTAPLVRTRSAIADFFSNPSVNTGIAASIAVVGIAYALLLGSKGPPARGRRAPSLRDSGALYGLLVGGGAEGRGALGTHSALDDLPCRLLLVPHDSRRGVRGLSLPVHRSE